MVSLVPMVPLRFESVRSDHVQDSRNQVCEVLGIWEVQARGLAKSSQGRGRGWRTEHAAASSLVRQWGRVCRTRWLIERSIGGAGLLRWFCYLWVESVVYGRWVD